MAEFEVGTYAPSSEAAAELDIWDEGYAYRPSDIYRSDWGVCLPHQCSEWVIASGNDHAAVIAEAKRFRDALDEAIGRLERGEEHPLEP